MNINLDALSISSMVKRTAWRIQDMKMRDWTQAIASLFLLILPDRPADPSGIQWGKSRVRSVRELQRGKVRFFEVRVDDAVEKAEVIYARDDILLRRLVPWEFEEGSVLKLSEEDGGLAMDLLIDGFPVHVSLTRDGVATLRVNLKEYSGPSELRK